MKWHLCEGSTRDGEEGAVILKCITEMAQGRDARMGQAGRTTAGPRHIQDSGILTGEQEALSPGLHEEDL